VPYATRDDVFQLALSAQAFVTFARQFDAADTTTATIRLKAHGLSLDDIITFECSDGGQLPTGISAFQSYYPLPVSFDLFRLSLTPHGLPIMSWASIGSGWAVAVDPLHRLDRNLVERAAFIDEHLTAETPPILVDPITGKYPEVLIGLNARLAARQTCNSLDVDNVTYKVFLDRLFASVTDDNEMLKAWKGGKPINPRPTDATLAVDNGARASSSREAIDWSPGVL